jgi:hypothetical protein
MFMQSIVIAFAACLLTFGFGVGGHLLRRRVSERHMSGGSKEMIGAVMGLVTLLLALVLGTLVGSSYSVFAAQKANVETLCMRAVQLDLAFREFGADADPLRKVLESSMQGAYDAVWGSGGAYRQQFDASVYMASFLHWDDMVDSLNAKTPTQRQLLGVISAESSSFQQTRILTSLQLAGTMSWPLLIVVISWAMLLFCGYGVLSGVNGTSAFALGLGAFAVASAIFLVVELSQPYTGVFRVPPGSMERTLAALKA